MTIAQDDPRLQTLDAEMAKEAWNVIKQDCAGFIKTFVHIKDEDAGIATPFSLWPEQERALEEIQEHKWSVVLKARQIGLTWLALAYAVWCMLCRVGFSVTVISQTEIKAKELVSRCEFILRYMPAWIITYGKKAEHGLTWESTSQQLTIHHPNGEDSTLLALPSAPATARSLTASLLILDEWAFQEYADQIWSSAFPTINRPSGGQVVGLSTCELGTLFVDIWNGAVAGENGFHPIFLSWKADPRRTREWYENTKRALPRSYRREYPATPEDAFSIGEGAAFEEWDEDIHVPFDASWYPPQGWKIYRTYDSGYSTRAACVWIAVGNDGQAVAYREYYPTRVTDPDQAQIIKDMSRDLDGNPEEIAYTVADPACWQKQSATGIPTSERFAQHGVPLRKADNDRINGWKRLHEWLKPYEGADGNLTAKLVFTKACANTRRIMPTLTMDKARPEDVDDSGEDHLADALRYFVMSRPSAPISHAEQRKRRRRRQQAIKPINKWTGY